MVARQVSESPFYQHKDCNNEALSWLSALRLLCVTGGEKVLGRDSG